MYLVSKAIWVQADGTVRNYDYFLNLHYKQLVVDLWIVKFGNDKFAVIIYKWQLYDTIGGFSVIRSMYIVLRLARSYKEGHSILERKKREE